MNQAWTRAFVSFVLFSLPAAYAACSAGYAPGTTPGGASGSSSTGSSSGSSGSSGGGPQSSPIQIQDLAMGCSSASDCEAVAQTASCCDACRSGAISKSQRATYNTRATAARSMIRCDGEVACPDILCVDTQVACTSNRCVVSSGTSSSSSSSSSGGADGGDSGADSH